MTEDAAVDEEGAPGGAAKASYHTFRNDITRRLCLSGVGDSSFFPNYLYVSL